MNTLPENEFDLEKMFLPAWAQEPSSTKRFAAFRGDEGEPSGKDKERDRAPRGPRRGAPGKGPKQRPPPERRHPADRGEERAPGRFKDKRPREERRPPPAPLPELNVTLAPDEKGVESLARQIKMTGRAYPLFEIARFILQKPERHSVTFAIKKNAAGAPVQPLYACALDDTLWLSEDEAVEHVLRRHFNTFYQTERTPTEPPKGTYTFVAQCGLSGIILGPPNYHDYQTRLHKLHADRFGRMPFDAYKAKVKIVRDPDVVKKWIDEQSFKTEYACLNVPEPLRLNSREEVEGHFRQVHLSNIIKPVDTFTIGGKAARSLRSPELTRLVRHVQEEQRRFPLQLATALSHQFAAHGLQFFKVNKTITHVCVARPHFLDLETTPVSEGVRNIVQFINEHSRCTRRQLIEALAPSPAPAAAPAEPGPTGQAQAPPPAESFEPTPEQTAVIADLHWLIHQGHVLEFANGIMDTAKKPAPKPAKPPPPQPAEQPAEGPAAAEPAAAPTAESVPVTESSPPTDEGSVQEQDAAIPEPGSQPGQGTTTVSSEPPSTQEPEAPTETQSMPVPSRS